MWLLPACTADMPDDIDTVDKLQAGQKPLPRCHVFLPSGDSVVAV
jgi:hypothetical protein